MTQLSFWSNDDSKIGKKILSNNKLNICNNITKKEEAHNNTKLGKHDDIQKIKNKKKCKKIYIPRIVNIEEHYSSKPIFFLN